MAARNGWRQAAALMQTPDGADDASWQPSAASQSPAAAPSQIVFIEGDVPDARQLAEGVTAGTLAVILNPDADGVQQIAAYLASHAYANLTAIDIVAHGADGEVSLGSATLSAATIPQYQAALATIGAALQPGGELNLYSCDVAQDTAGTAFIQQLSRATGGANVGAASHLVGDAAGGGSWNLNVDTGSVAATDPFTAAALAGYQGELSAAGGEIVFATFFNGGTAGAVAGQSRVEELIVNASGTVTGTVDIIDKTMNANLYEPFGFAYDAALGKYVVVNSDDNGINQIATGTLGSSALTQLVSMPTDGQYDQYYNGIALDQATGTVYFGEVTAPATGGTGGIYEININGGAVTPLATGLGDPNEIALDAGDGVAFFTDIGWLYGTGTSNLDVVNLASGVVTNLNSELSAAVQAGINDFTTGVGIYGIALDAATHTIYFTSNDYNNASTGYIMSATYSVTGSGSSAAVTINSSTVMYSGNLGSPGAISIDPAAGVFFVNSIQPGQVLEGSLTHTGGGGSLTAVYSDGSASWGDSLFTAPLPTITTGGTVTFNVGDSPITLDASLTLSNADSSTLATASVIDGNFITGDTLTVGTPGGLSHSFSNGTLTLSGSASLATYQTALRSVAFGFSPSSGDPTQGGSDAHRTFSWTVGDAALTSQVSTSALAATDIGAVVAPTVTASGTVAFTGGGSAVTLDSGLTVTESGSTLASATVVIGGFISGDTLTVGTAGGIGSSFSNGTLTLSGTASLATYQTALDTVAYGFSPANGDPTGGGTHISRSISWSVNDGTSASTAAGSTLNIVHAAPSVTASGTATFMGGGSAVTLDAGLSLADADSAGNLASATVIIGGFISGDTLTVGSTGGLSSSFSNGTLTLSGTASLATYQAALESVAYGFNPANGDPTGGGSHISRSISWSVNDGVASSAAGNSSLSVVHAAPAITAGGTVSYTGGGSAVVLDSGLTVTDADSGGIITSATIGIGGAITGDTLNFTNQNGISGSFSSGTDVLTLSGSATVAQYQSALDSITYSSSAGDPSAGGAHGSRTISWTVNDGVAASSSASSTLDTLAPHNGPTVTASGTVSFTGGGSAVALDSGLTLTESGSTLASATVIIGGFISGDTLTVGTAGGLTSSFSNGTLTLSGTASLTTYQAALDSVAYGFSPANGDPTGGGSHTSRSISWSVNDGVANGTAASSTLDTLHAAPAVTSGGTVSFTGGGSAVVLDSGLTLADADSAGTLASAKVVIGGFISGDTLTVGTAGGLTTSFSNGTLTLSGSASVATYQTALDSVAYGFSPANGDPTGGGSHTTRSISWTVNDGVANSTAGSSTLNEVHVAPTVTAGGTVSFTGGGSPVVLDSTLTLADVDSAGQLTGATVAITSGFAAVDVLDFINQNGISGSYNSGTGVLTLSGAASLANYRTALESVSYGVTTNGDPTVGGADTSRTISWSVNDGVATSSASSSALATVHAGPTITASGTASFTGGGSPVLLDAGLVVADADSGGNLASGTVVIGGFISGDTLTVGSAGSLTTSFSNGTLTLSGSASLATYQTALESVAYGFSPANGDPTGGGSHASRSISWSVNDGVASSAAGSTALNTVHAGPTITASGTATFTGGGSAVALDAGLSVADTDSAGNLASATVIIGGFITGDTLTVGTPGGLSSSFSNGTLTLSGTASLTTYQAALDSVAYGFGPANGDPTGGGSHTTRSISWSVNDGVANSTAGSSTLDTVHAAPTVASGGTVSFTGGGSAVVLDSGLTLAATDSAGTLASAKVVIGGFISGDTLTVGTAGGLSGSFSNGTLTLSGSASVAAYQTALDSVAYGFSPANGDPTGGGSHTTRSISWTVNDGVANSTAGSSTLNEVHVAPTVTAGGTVSFTGGGSPVVLDSTLTLADVDSAGQLTGATVAITSGFAAVDVLDFINQNGISGSYNSGTGVLTLSGAASLVNYRTALESVSYGVTTNGDPTVGGTDTSRTISWSVNDGVAASSASSSRLNTIHTAPTITAGGTVTYDSGSLPVALDSGLVVTDPDSGGVLTGATVVIGAGFLTGDTLTVGTPGSLTTAFSNGTLTLSGSGSIATYQAALDSVGYSFAPATTDPTAGNTDVSRAIAWTVNDGVATAAGSSSVTVAAIYNQATAWVESTGAGTLSGSGTSYTLDFGTVAQGAAVPAGVLELLNAAPGLADALNATLSITGPLPSFINTGITAIGPLTGGQTSSGLDVSLRTTATGTFSETLTLLPTDTGSGGTTALSPITILVTGTVAAPAGQVIDLTTGTDTDGGGSTPTTVVAQTNQLSAGDTIDAGTSGSNTLELQGPGTFQLNAPSVLTGIQTITAQEGQTAYSRGRLSSVSEVQTVTLRAGMNATLDVLPAVINPNNPNAPTITIIGAANTAVINLATGNDVVTMGAGETLNGGTGNDTIMVSAATISDVINGGSGQSTLQFSGGGSVTLGSNITNIATLQLKAATTAYNASANSIAGLTVLDSDTANADTIQAGGANQILTGGGAGKLTLIGAANTDFADTLTLFNHDHIQNFLVGDSIDLTNLGFTAAGTGAGQTNLSFSGGALSVMLGTTVQTSINIAGSVNPAKFTIGSDGGTGTLLTYHA